MYYQINTKIFIMTCSELKSIVQVETGRIYNRAADPIYYIHKTTNTITGQYYLGTHRYFFDEIDPNYYGGGKLLRASVKEYGKENHTVIILKKTRSYKAVRNALRKYLTDEVINDPLNINTRRGAPGLIPKESPAKQLEKLRTYRREYYRKYRKTHRETLREYNNEHIKNKDTKECIEYYTEICKKYNKLLQDKNVLKRYKLK